jgi:hypothetical protein
MKKRTERPDHWLLKTEEKIRRATAVMITVTQASRIENLMVALSFKFTQQIYNRLPLPYRFCYLRFFPSVF